MPTNLETGAANACVACRARHVKCDSQRPRCSRCDSAGICCQYVPSRRGRRNYKRDTSSTVAEQSQARSEQDPSYMTILSNDLSNSNSAAFQSTAPPSDFNVPDLYTSWQYMQQDGLSLCQTGPLVGQYPVGENLHTIDFNLSSINAPPLDVTGLAQGDVSSVLQVKSSDRLVHLFYAHFHPAHTFMVPQSYLSELQTVLPTSTQQAMQLAGSQFVMVSSQQQLSLHADEILSLASSQRDPFSVQALLIIAIVCYGRSEKHQSHSALRRAVELAEELDFCNFGTLHSLANGDVIVKESFLRTWWELEITISVVATFATAATGTRSPRLKLKRGNLPLPCDEFSYNALFIPTSARTQDQFLDRTLLGDTCLYPSAAYKIEAARLLRAVHDFEDDQESLHTYQLLVSSLANAQLSLPLDKREVVRSNGSVDEALLAAKVLVFVATIILSQSQPDSSDGDEGDTDGSLCKPYAQCGNGFSAKANDQIAVTALQAADSIAIAANTRSSTCTVMCHSPFYICAAALACKTHLMAYLSADVGAARDLIKERVKLGVNALGRISENWALAEDVRTQVRQDAQKLLFRDDLSA